MGGERAPRWIDPTGPIIWSGRSSRIHASTDPDPRRHPISASRLGQTDRSDDVVEDRAAVDAVLAGDVGAFRTLVDRESASVIRACHRVLGNQDGAEDAAQEAFVTAYRSLAGWRAEGPFGAWLTRIAVRIALRQAGRRKAVTWLDPIGETDGAGRDPIMAAIDQIAVQTSGSTDPASLSVRSEQAVDVRAALASLPEPYREVVTLRFFGELSLDEIARQTERPIGTVKTHLRRGLLRLREAMAGQGAA